MTCKNCGTEITEGVAFCSKCGTKIDYYSEPQSTTDNSKAENVDENIKKMSQLAKTTGILSILFGTVGAVLFGSLPAIAGIACAAVGLANSIKVRKYTDEKQGTSAFVISIIGLIFSILLFVSCTFCGACTCGYGCYGCAGSTCKSVKDVDGLNRAFMRDYYDKLDN